MAVTPGKPVTPSDFNGARVIRRHQRVTNASATSGTTEQQIMRIDDVPLTAGKLYRINTGPVLVDGSVANDVCRLVLRASSSGTATTSSTQLGIAQTVVANTSLPECLSVDVAYAPGSGDQTLSVLLSYVRQSGTGVFQALGDATFPMNLFVVEFGDDPGDTGTDL